MGGKKPQKPPSWPELEFNIDPNLLDHAEIFLKEAAQIETIATENQTSPPIELFLSLVQSAREIARRVKKVPSAASITKELREIRSLLNTQGDGLQSALKSINAIENQSARVVAAIRTPQQGPPAIAKTLSRPASWAHVTSTPAGSIEPLNASNTPTTIAPASEDLEIHLRGTNPVVVDPLRKGQEAKVIQRANQAIKDTADPAIQHRKFSSGRVLPSGDVLLQADSVEDMAQLIKMPLWCRAFGEQTFIKKRTFGVIMYGVECDKINPHQKTEAKAQLGADNAGRLSHTPANINHVGWLLGARKVKDLHHSMLVVEFDDERAANTAIGRGLVLKGKNHICSRYDKSFSIQQCFNCQTYGHIAKYCKRTALCAYDAENHFTDDCKHPRDRTRARCAVCIDKKLPEEQTKHFAFDRECPARAMRMEEARSLRISGPQFYAPVARPGDIQTPGIPDQAEDPTPAEASTATRRSRSKAAKTRKDTTTESAQTVQPAPSPAMTRSRSKSNMRGGSISKVSKRSNAPTTGATEGPSVEDSTQEIEKQTADQATAEQVTTDQASANGSIPDLSEMRRRIIMESPKIAGRISRPPKAPTVSRSLGKFSSRNIQFNLLGKSGPSSESNKDQRTRGAENTGDTEEAESQEINTQNGGNTNN